jgi:hypothetical protein
MGQSRSPTWPLTMDSFYGILAELKERIRPETRMWDRALNRADNHHDGHSLPQIEGRAVGAAILLWSAPSNEQRRTRVCVSGQ